jgi:gas vesicle protein GvpN
MMTTQSTRGEETYIKAHPDFCAIFTSNPEEYAGVNRTQDALRDRMVTMDIDHFDYETELQIVIAKSKLLWEDSQKIVKIVRGLRESGKTEFDPTIRGSIMIAKTMATLETTPSESKELFTTICQDILSSETSRIGSKTNQDRVRLIVKDLIQQHY